MIAGVSSELGEGYVAPCYLSVTTKVWKKSVASRTGAEDSSETKLHDVTSQITINLILPSVTTWNLTQLSSA
jgi:hypothetical protein